MVDNPGITTRYKGVSVYIEPHLGQLRMFPLYAADTIHGSIGPGSPVIFEDGDNILSNPITE